MQEPKRVTLKLIAERAGTSIGTVERALKDRQGVSQETRTRVLDIAQQLGYMPNPFANALRRRASIRLALVYPQQPDAFYADMQSGIDVAGEGVSDFGVEVVHIRYPLHQQEAEAQVLATLRADEYQGIAINSAGPGVAAQIDRLAAAGLPVITFNTDAANSRRRFFVGTDSVESGSMGAALLGRFLGGKGTVTVLGHFLQTTPFSERFGGFCHTLHQQFEQIRLIPCAECSTVQAAEQNLLALLAAAPELQGVFCTGYSSTVGAVNALRQTGRKDIALVGYDTSAALLDALQEGWCDALLYQDPYLQGYTAVQTLAQHVLDQQLPDVRKTKVYTNIILKQNADSYR